MPKRKKNIPDEFSEAERAWLHKQEEEQIFNMRQYLFLILESVMKTNKVIFVDEDVPGGATAYMMQKVLDEQKAFNYLDTAPRALSAMEHRPAYGIDGEYFSKPNVEKLFRSVYEMMRETDPKRFPAL